MRVAAYARVSTDKEDQLHSLAAQQHFFQEYIRTQPGWVCVGIFADEGLSGTCAAKRPQFTAMLRLAQEGEIDLILTKEVSRFARNTVDTLTITRQLKAAGVGVVFLSDGIDTRDSDGEFRLTIMASVAQEESRKISERTRWGQEQAMKRGVVFGNNSIYGYTLAGGVLTVCPEQAQVIRRVYDKFLTERKGTHVIARELTEEGISPPLRPGGSWSSTMVLRLLRNEKYTGDLLQHKYRTTDHLTHRKIPNPEAASQYLLTDHHEGIISRERFLQAQEELSRRSNLTGRHSTPRCWFSGKVICGSCGGLCTVKTTRRTDGSVYRRLVCRNRCGIPAPGQSRCAMRAVSEEEAAACARHVLSLLPLDREGILRQVMAVRPAPSSRQELQTAILRQTRRKERAQEAFLDGLIQKEDLRTLSERCDREIHRLQELLLAEKHPGQEMQTQLHEALRGSDCVLDEVIDRIVIRENSLLLRSGPLLFLAEAEKVPKNRGNPFTIRTCTQLSGDIASAILQFCNN